MVLSNKTVDSFVHTITTCKAYICSQVCNYQQTSTRHSPVQTISFITSQVYGRESFWPRLWHSANRCIML